MVTYYGNTRLQHTTKHINAGNVHQFHSCYLIVPGLGSMLTPLGQAVGVMRPSGQPEQLRCAPNFQLHPHVRPCLRPALVPGPVPPPAVRQGWRLVVWYTGTSCVFVFTKNRQHNALTNCQGRARAKRVQRPGLMVWAII